MSKYWELLQDPQWQRRRLEVLSSADFTCEECGDKETTLHVHHMYYERGKKPWEYPDEALRVLCKTCHEIVGDKQAELNRAVAELPTRDIDLTIGFVRARLLLRGIGVPLGNVVQTMGIALFFDATIDDVMAIADGSGWVSAGAINKLVTDRLLERARGIGGGEPTV